MKPAPHPHATHFITLRLADRRSDLLVRQISVLRTAMRATMGQMPFALDAITVLPAIAHMIVVLPEAKLDPVARILMLKRRFAQLAAPATIRPDGPVPSIWHRDHWMVRLETALDRTRHRSMIHHAPVEAGLCAQPQEWPHSSLHRDLRHEGHAPAKSKPTSVTAPAVSQEALLSEG